MEEEEQQSKLAGSMAVTTSDFRVCGVGMKAGGRAVERVVDIRYRQG